MLIGVVVAAVAVAAGPAILRQEVGDSVLLVLVGMGHAEDVTAIERGIVRLRLRSVPEAGQKNDAFP